MGRTDYVLRSLAKIANKRWEHYVINRIYHRLNDPEIEFVCQQCIRKDDNKIYLADLFFPQFNLYLEIDEPHHAKEEAMRQDAIRRFDIANASELEEKRIDVFEALIDEVDVKIQQFVDLLRSRKSEDSNFTPWDYEHRYKPQTHIERGFIEVGPRAAFRYQKDALKCFGYEKGHYQRGAWELPASVCDEIGLYGKSMVWFPRLYVQKNWDNSLSDDGTIISERNKFPEHSYAEKWDNRVVMARSRDFLNRTMYHFVGVFRVVPEYSSGNERRFERVLTRIPTISR